MAGMTNLDTKAEAAPALQARRLSGLRRASLSALVMLCYAIALYLVCAPAQRS